MVPSTGSPSKSRSLDSSGESTICKSWDLIWYTEVLKLRSDVKQFLKNKKIYSVVLVLLLVASCQFAFTQWWVGYYSPVMKHKTVVNQVVSRWKQYESTRYDGLLPCFFVLRNPFLIFFLSSGSVLVVPQEVSNKTASLIEFNRFLRIKHIWSY